MIINIVIIVDRVNQYVENIENYIQCRMKNGVRELQLTRREQITVNKPITGQKERKKDSGCE